MTTFTAAGSLMTTIGLHMGRAQGKRSAAAGVTEISPREMIVLVIQALDETADVVGNDLFRAIDMHRELCFTAFAIGTTTAPLSPV